MKIFKTGFVIVLFVLMMGGFAFGQTTLYVPGGTTGIGASSTGNVGIGTTSPGYLLSVMGEAQVDRLRGKINEDFVITSHGNASGEGFTFKTNAGATTAMKIDINGNVGIGTTSPVEKLHITGNLYIDGQNFSKIDFKRNVASSLWRFSIGNFGTNDLYIHPAAGVNNNIVIANNNRDKLITFNTSNGNVGIGTTSPGAKLEVSKLNGDNHVQGIARFFNPEATSDDRHTSIWIGKSQGVGLCGVLGYYSYPSNTNDAGIFLCNYGDNEKTNSIYVKKGGNVGIGTDLSSNPSNFKLAVKGTIGAQEIKVQQTIPDYVFEENYTLRSLAEVEQFINKNKHLPDIPSASSFEDKMVPVGEMQSKLLQKVEELTLYMIELKKENETLKNRVAKLESE